ncbi:MAG: hypothetical protein ACYDBB_21295 [Armatimonadota bacterium]
MRQYIGVPLVLFAALLFVGLSPAWGAHLGTTLYVNASAAGANTGTSWTDAFTDLQDALDSALLGDEIWVAAGTYTPRTTIDGSSDPRNAAFLLKSGVKIYGGFAGDENQLHKRPLGPSVTVLSGDIGTAGDDSDNSYHVVYANGVTDAVLDGFTVTGGRGDGGGNYSDYQGAGMHNTNSALTVANCTFIDNKVAVLTNNRFGHGGGMYNDNSAPIVTNCTFSANQAGNVLINSLGTGGGMCNYGYFGSGIDRQQPVITGCTFSNNIASSKSEARYGGGGMANMECAVTVDSCTFTENMAGCGGGMLNYLAEPTITNCIFNGNTNTYGEGRGGAIYNLASATIINCTFYKNGWRAWYYPPYDLRPYTSFGGAIYDERAGSKITNCLFSGNAVRGNGGAIYSATMHPNPYYRTTLTNCLFYDNIRWQVGYEDPVMSHVTGSPLSPDSISNLFDIDPLLIDPAGGDFHLRYDSPCIDAGTTLKFAKIHWLPMPAKDFDGDKRIVDADGDDVPAADIGMDEFMPNLPDLRAFLEALAANGELDEATAACLLAYVDDAQAALDQQAKQTAINILNALIADAEASVGNTETAQRIVKMTEMVIEHLD